mmetsp:Transcript_46280/g.108612  ORF Transcript_46280/g.108612 Transcript_46280/m.108612 type:complete len:238 (-) Transcript_46280:651-1364(-)
MACTRALSCRTPTPPPTANPSPATSATTSAVTVTGAGVVVCDGTRESETTRERWGASAGGSGRRPKWMRSWPWSSWRSWSKRQSHCSRSSSMNVCAMCFSRSKWSKSCQRRSLARRRVKKLKRSSADWNSLPSTPEKLPEPETRLNLRPFSETSPASQGLRSLRLASRRSSQRPCVCRRSPAQSRSLRTWLLEMAESMAVRGMRGTKKVLVPRLSACCCACCCRCRTCAFSASSSSM